MIPEPARTIQHALTVELPTTEVVTPMGTRHLPASTITITSGDLAAGQAADNAVQLLQVLYAHGVTSPDLLRFTLRAAGHSEQRTPPPAAAPETRTSPRTSSLAGLRD